MYKWQMVSSLGGCKGSYMISSILKIFRNYLESYTDGVDPVHCTWGTCILSE